MFWRHSCFRQKRNDSIFIAFSLSDLSPLLRIQCALLSAETGIKCDISGLKLNFLSNNFGQLHPHRPLENNIANFCQVINSSASLFALSFHLLRDGLYAGRIFVNKAIDLFFLNRAVSRAFSLPAFTQASLLCLVITVIHSCTPRRLASSHVLMHSWRQFNPLLLSWGRAAYYSTDIKRSVCLRGRYIRRIAVWKFRSHWEEIIGGLWMSSTVFKSNLWGFPFMAWLLNGANWICTSTKEWKGKTRKFSRELRKMFLEISNCHFHAFELSCHAIARRWCVMSEWDLEMPLRS